MALRVSGKNFDIGDAFRTHIHQRIAATLAKYYSGDINGHVMVAPDGTGYRTECALHLSSGTTLETEAKGHEVYACFDQSADRLEKRLRRYKSRLKDRHGGNNGADDVDATRGMTMVANYVIETPGEDAVDQRDFVPVTIAEKPSQLKRLSVADAVLELDLSGAPVVVFRHAGHGRVNVVYRRDDGNIGWVDPDTESSAPTHQ